MFGQGLRHLTRLVLLVHVGVDDHRRLTLEFEEIDELQESVFILVSVLVVQKLLIGLGSDPTQIAHVESGRADDVLDLVAFLSIDLIITLLFIDSQVFQVVAELLSIDRLFLVRV